MNYHLWVARGTRLVHHARSRSYDELRELALEARRQFPDPGTMQIMISYPRDGDIEHF
jgi:hypothetical protein